MSDAIAATEKAMRETVPDLLGKVFAASGKASVEALKKLRTTKGNGSNQYRQKGGTAERSRRAAMTHKGVSMKTRAMAAESEKQLTRMIGPGAKRTEDTQHNAPMDVVSGKHAFEVKTMTENENDKITMHPSSKDRKEAWAQNNRATTHTVIFDKRNRYSRDTVKNYSGHDVYYRRGLGSFRLAGMTKVKDASHLRKLIGE